MGRVAAAIARAIDIRRGETSTVVRAMASLFFLITSHTTLETVRDALLLSRFPVRDLGIVYLASAVGVLPVAALMPRITLRAGARRALVGAALAVAALLVALFAIRTRPATLVAIYVASALSGGVMIPLFWSLLANVFTVAQGRRLLGIVAGAGTLGGAAGAALAALLLNVMRVKALLLVSAALIIVGLILPPRPDDGEASGTIDGKTGPRSSNLPGTLQRDPFVLRIATLVSVSTATLLVIDFFFKWTVARSLEPHEVARFVARYYAALNGAALLAQLFASRSLLRRFGLPAAMVVTPLLLLGAAVAPLVSGASLVAVLVLKTIDGTLRNSVHRVTSELLYLPLSASTSARVKPLIDGGLARFVQAGAGALLLVLGSAGHLSAWTLTTATCAGLGLWVAVAWTSRAPYLALLRRAVLGNAAGTSGSMDPLDMETAEALIELLSDDDPLVVLGAMNALTRRGRARLVPALILFHDSTAVLLRALALFGASEREDWIRRARQLLADKREPVRLAAARALALHRALQADDLTNEASPRLRGYASLHFALAESDGDPLEARPIRDVLQHDGAEGEEERLGLLSSVADSARDPRLTRLVAALGRTPRSSPEWTAGVARAAAAQQVTELVPRLVSRLVANESREAVRNALLSFGTLALEELRRALADPETPRRVRIQLPDSIRRFGDDDAARALLDTIETDADGLVRYKAIRALGRLVVENRVRVDRKQVARMALRNLLEYFRLLGLRAPFDATPIRLPTGERWRDPTERIMVGLLNDKVRQSLERTFRLLKIAYPNEDIHGAHVAYLSEDKRARANAAEFLDTLLRQQKPLGELLRLGAEDGPLTELVERARALLPAGPPADRAQALGQLVGDSDSTLSALAKLHAAAASGQAASVWIGVRDGTGVELSL